MKLRLRPPSHLPPGLQSCYDASDLNVALGGLLLSRAGVVGNEGEVKLKICIPCQTSLLDKKRVNPPKFAIANGLWVGRLPAIFEDSTFTENAMLNLSQPMHYISVGRGGKHSSLRSHAYFVRAEPQLDCHEASTHDGAISGVQSSEVATEALAGDRPSSNSLFPRSKNHQKTFQSEIGSDSASTNFDLPNNTILRSMFQDGLNDLDRSTWRHNAPAPAHQNVEGIDEIHEQASVGWISNFSHVDVPTGIQLALDKSRVIVDRSSSILSDFDPAFWVNAFSELFPYGRRGLDEPRTVPIGVHEFIRYWLRLSSLRHAQHRSFAMASFDVIARHNSLQAISIKARISPSSMDRIASVPREDLQIYIQYQQDRLRAANHQLQPPDAPDIDLVRGNYTIA
ncbi:unnamed protein product [Phytophthora fragariaefolia]|uniref:Unnamed protein product n=1 Tax=Phytophthora fragariaefolia TaxID=1490495 RepID=A0A9W6XUT6_9STRA|nr:unnamed protein product [Phytophthora fragariaefolia]